MNKVCMIQYLDIHVIIRLDHDMCISNISSVGSKLWYLISYLGTWSLRKYMCILHAHSNVYKTTIFVRI